MTTHTIDATQNAGLSGLVDDARGAAAAISAGWRAARDWRRLSARPNGMSREQVARAVFERHFA